MKILSAGSLHWLVLVSCLGFSVMGSSNVYVKIYPSGGKFTKRIDSALVLSCRAENVDPATEHLSMKWINPQGTPITATSGRVYVEQDGPDYLKVYIMKMSTSDVGRYICVAEVIENSLTVAARDSIELLIHEPVRLEISSSEVSAEVGQDVLVGCVSIGTTKPPVRWFLPNRRRMTERHEATDEGLLIKGVNESDAGIYTCAADDGYSWEEKSIKLTVTTSMTFNPLSTKDVYTFSSNNVHVKIKPSGPQYVRPAGSALVLSCTAENVDPDTVQLSMKWTDPQGTPILTSTGRVYADQDELTVLKVYMTDMISSDAGSYTCVAEVTENSRTVSARDSIELLVYEPLSLMVSSAEVLARDGQDVMLGCVSIGSSKPPVQWLFEDEPIHITDRHTVTDEGLYIRDVSESDVGTYFCRADDKTTGEQAEEIINLYVENLGYINDSVPPIRYAENLEDVLRQMLRVLHKISDTQQQQLELQQQTLHILNRNPEINN